MLLYRCSGKENVSMFLPLHFTNTTRKSAP
jgi:hypothetical protein